MRQYVSSFLCHLVFSWVSDPDVSVRVSCVPYQSCMTFPLHPSLMDKKCNINKYGPYFLFIYADRQYCTRCACVPTSSCSYGADPLQNKEVSQTLICFQLQQLCIIGCMVNLTDVHHIFRDKSPFIYNLDISFRTPSIFGEVYKEQDSLYKSYAVTRISPHPTHFLLLSHSDTQ